MFGPGTYRELAIEMCELACVVIFENHDKTANLSTQALITEQDEIMTTTKLTDDLAYDPNNLLDALIEKMQLKNDAALSRALEVAPPVISKIRHRRLPVGASMLLRMHEVSEVSIRDLRDLMGDRREKFRISPDHFKPKEAPESQS